MQTWKVFIFLALIGLFSCDGPPKQVEPEAKIDIETLLKTATDLHDAGEFDSTLVLVGLVLSTDSHNLAAKKLEGDSHFALRNYGKAMKAYTTCLRWDKKSPEIWAILGKIYLNQKDFESSLKYFNQAINLDQTNDDAYIGRALVFVGKGDLEQAYLSLQTAIDFNPNNRKAMIKMAEWKFADSNEVAIQYFTNALRIDSNDASIYFKRGQANRTFGKYRDAQKDYEKAIELEQGNWIALFNLAYLHFEFERYTEAKEYFNRCAGLKPQESDAWYGLALCAKGEGNTKEAIEMFEKLLSINPNDADAAQELEKLR